MNPLLPIDDELTLWLIQPGNAEEVFAVIDANRAHLTSKLPWPVMIRTAEDELRFAESAMARYTAGHFLACVICRQRAVVGGIGLEIQKQRIGTLERCEADMGYWLAVSEQGKGFVTRAAVALSDHGFGELGLRRITIRAEPHNARSRAVPERLGFSHEGTLRGVGWWDGRRIDHELYAMLAEDWPAARAAYQQRFAGDAGRSIPSQPQCRKADLG